MEREKGYYVKQSFSNDFVDYMEELYKKYGESIFEIQGIANKYMDIAQFSREFFGNSTNVADVSVDANANVREKNVTQYTFENNKAVMRLNSLYMLYKKIKSIYGVEDARIALEKVINGEIFVNDLHTFASMPYCYAFDLRTLLTEGMNFFHGNMKIGAPKRSDSFIALLIQSTAYISNQIAGAASYPDFFPVLDWFYRQELGEDYANKLRAQKDAGNGEVWSKVKNQLQNLIYSLNFPFRGGQSAFTNLSVMDHGFMNSLFKGYCFPDLTEPNINSTIELSKVFFEYFTEINCKEGVFTFPVTTVAISLDDKGEYIDPDFVDWSAKINSTKALANVFQDVPTSFSSCCRLRNDFSKMGDAGYQNSFGVGGLSIGCYDDKTEVMTENGFMLFDDVMKKYPNKDIKILTVNPVTNTLEYHYPTEYMEAEYDGEMHHYIHNSIDLLVTPNHNMFVESRKSGERKLIQSEYLKSGYRIPQLFAVNNDQDLELVTIEDKQYKADAFYKLIGLYLGDGATYHDVEEAKYRAYEISFQVKKNREINSIEETLKELNIKYSKSYIKTRGSWNIRFYDKTFWNAVQPLGKCLEKFIPEFILNDGGQSNLTNLLQGLLDTDGTSGNNGIWYYTSSLKLKNSVEILLSKLGIPFRTFQRERLPSFLIRDNRWITPNGTIYEIKLSLKDKYIERPSKYKKIEKYTGKIFCMEVPNHTLLVRRNGKTSVWCGNSHRVSGPNLPRLSILEKTNPNIIDEDLEITHKILFAHRELIKERIAGGFLPLYTSGWIDLERQYSTVGFVGGYEYVVNKGLKIENKNGQECLQKVLKKIEDKVSKWQENEKVEYVLNNKSYLGDKKIYISQAYKETEETTVAKFFKMSDFMEWQFAFDCSTPFIAVKTFREKKINNIYNCEQIPAESMAVRLAEIDKILGYNENYQLYSNQYIPLISEASIYDRFKIQGKFDSLTSGGAILHINVDDEKPIDPKQFENLMNCARLLKTKYFAINYAYSECADGHYIVGKHDSCPICEKPIVQQYTRVVGFITPVKSWNSTRRKFEYPNRVFYKNGSLDIEKQIEK